MLKYVKHQQMIKQKRRMKLNKKTLLWKNKQSKIYKQ